MFSKRDIYRLVNTLTVEMVELRSGAKINNNNGDYESSPKKTVATSEDPNNMTLVVFFGLLIDLLAFTLILPLFPSLLDHYKKNDGPDGLYHFLDSKVTKNYAKLKCYFNPTSFSRKKMHLKYASICCVFLKFAFFTKKKFITC